MKDFFLYLGVNSPRYCCIILLVNCILHGWMRVCPGLFLTVAGMLLCIAGSCYLDYRFNEYADKQDKKQLK